MQLILTKHGLNIASVTHIDDEKQINPLWIPKWQWTSPEKCRHLNIKDEYEQVTKLYINHKIYITTKNILILKKKNICIYKINLK